MNWLTTWMVHQYFGVYIPKAVQSAYDNMWQEYEISTKKILETREWMLKYWDMENCEVNPVVRESWDRMWGTL